MFPARHLFDEDRFDHLYENYSIVDFMRALIELMEDPLKFIDEFGLKETRYVFTLLKHYFRTCREEGGLEPVFREACWEAEETIRHWQKEVLIRTEENPNPVRDTRFTEFFARAAFEL